MKRCCAGSSSVPLTQKCNGDGGRVRARHEPRKLPHLHGQSSGIIEGVILRQLDESLSQTDGDVMLDDVKDDVKDVLSLNEGGIGS